MWYSLTALKILSSKDLQCAEENVFPLENTELKGTRIPLILWHITVSCPLRGLAIPPLQFTASFAHKYNDSWSALRFSCFLDFFCLLPFYFTFNSEVILILTHWTVFFKILWIHSQNLVEWWVEKLLHGGFFSETLIY